MPLITKSAKVPKVIIDIPVLSAEEVSAKSLEYLSRQGWCLWQCSTLNRDIICIIDPAIAENVPSIYPIYTVDELREMAKNDQPAIILLHEAKKLCNARIVTSG